MENNKKYKMIGNLPYSSYIDIENVFYININKPEKNMQDDYSNFESLAIILKIENPEAKIVLSFDESKVSWNGFFNRTDGDLNLYLRFLYRIVKFKEAFPDWFDVAKENKEIVEKFKNKLEQAKEDEKISNNIPNKEATEYYEGMKEEKRIETILSHTSEGKKYFKELYHSYFPDNELTDNIFNQLPNGLFYIKNNEKPQNGNRIFSTGYFDIWAIDKKQNLCVFELKKNEGNSALGIISELFFYSAYTKEFLCDKRFLHIDNISENYRGYKTLYNAIQEDKVKNVKAIFLVGAETHKLIKEFKNEIIELLNTNKLGIQYDFVEYDINKINDLNLKD